MQTFFYEFDQETQSNIKRLVYTGSRDFRVSYFENDFYFFCIYYFSKSMFFDTREFHLEWYKFATSGMDILNIAFRGSAKTAIFGLFWIVYCLAYKKEEFILFLAFKGPDSVLKITNIINVLKTNKRFISDYGYLYEDDRSKKRGKDTGVQPKTQSRFVSTNGILVQAVSLESGVRGLNFYEDGKVMRPTLVVADDIDVLKSVRNIDIVDKNYDFIANELFGGLEGRFIFLGNIISDDGVVPRLIKNYGTSEKVAYIEQPLIENAVIVDEMVVSGDIVMPDKYYWTVQQADEAQELRIAQGLPGKVKSIEFLARGGNAPFMSNYQNIAYMVIGDPVFTTSVVQKIEPMKPIKVIRFKVGAFSTESTPQLVELFFFKECNEFLCCGVDVGGGNGGDYTDVTFVDSKDNLVARFRSNTLKTEQTAAAIKYIINTIGLKVYKNALGIERNNAGIAVINGLMDDKFIYQRIYLKEVKGKVGVKPSKDRGWWTGGGTGGTKEIMIGALRASSETGKLQIDATQKSEMLTYIIDDKGSYNAQSGKYDDSVVSRAIAKQMTLTFKY